MKINKRMCVIGWILTFIALAVVPRFALFPINFAEFSYSLNANCVEMVCRRMNFQSTFSIVEDGFYEMVGRERRFSQPLLLQKLPK